MHSSNFNHSTAFCTECSFASLDVLEHSPRLVTALTICSGRKKQPEQAPKVCRAAQTLRDMSAGGQTDRRQGARRNRKPAARIGERARLPRRARWPSGGPGAGSHARVTRRHRGAPYFHRSGSPPGDYVRPSARPGRGWCPQSSPRPAAWTHHPAGTRPVDPGGHTLPAAPDPLGSLLRVRARLCAGARARARACSRAPRYRPREVTICTHPGRLKCGFGRARIPRGGVPI